MTSIQYSLLTVQVAKLVENLTCKQDLTILRLSVQIPVVAVTLFVAEILSPCFMWKEWVSTDYETKKNDEINNLYYITEMLLK